MRKLIVTGVPLVIGALASAGSAWAADLPVKAPSIAPAFTWTGLYLGINAGYGTGEGSGRAYCTDPAGVVGGAGCFGGLGSGSSASGGFVGGQLGFNYQTGLFVWGVESDIQVSHINGSSAVATDLAGNSGLFTRTQDLDWFGTVRGRLGLAIWDRALVYGTGGMMYGEEVVNSNLAFPVVGYQAQASGTHTGWTAGVGIEYAFTNALSARIEGLYYDLGSETVAYKNTFSGYTQTADFAYKGALVRLGANLKFGP